jgi:hypothetical protein
MSKEKSKEIIEKSTESKLDSSKLPDTPIYRRDIHPTNFVMSASDLENFVEIIATANEKAISVEIASADLADFNNDKDHAIERINELMPIQYEYVADNLDKVVGQGSPDIDAQSFPNSLSNIFVSNAVFARKTVNQRPRNTVEAFLSFKKPTLKIDLNSFPSNPTENDCIINVEGYDEDWVISTTEKINQFFSKLRTFRPMIHKSGTYDYFTYLVFFPVVIWLFYRLDGSSVISWLDNKSIFINIVTGIYTVLLALLVLRFIYQYIRWLFPPTEYYKTNRTRTYFHRILGGGILGTLTMSAVYDVSKNIILALLT